MWTLYHQGKHYWAQCRREIKYTEFTETLVADANFTGRSINPQHDVTGRLPLPDSIVQSTRNQDFSPQSSERNSNSVWGGGSSGSVVPKILVPCPSTYADRQGHGTDFFLPCRLLLWFEFWNPTVRHREENQKANISDKPGSKAKHEIWMNVVPNSSSLGSEMENECNRDLI